MPFMRPLRFALLALIASGACGAVHAQDAAALPVVRPDIDGSPSSRNLIGALKALQQLVPDEAALRAASGQTPLATFRFDGQDIILLAGSDAWIPRRALAPPGRGVAFVLKLAALPDGVGCQAAEGDSTYVLATANGSKIVLWTFLRDMPSDGSLSRRMLKALATLDQPLATFDPKAQPDTTG